MFILTSVAMSSTYTSAMTLQSYLADKQKTHLDELFEFLRIPSVSTNPEHTDDVRKAGEFVKVRLESLNFSTQLFDTPRHPVVYAERHVSDDAPTLLIYGHYDVQPAEPLELWDSPPFEPTLKDGLIVARGASDDKGQVYAHIKGAEAALELNPDLPLNLKFLIEGEEEIGSPNLTPFVEQHNDLLAADTVLISDNTMMAPGIPTVTYGLKGLVYIEVSVTGPSLDLHSGAFGGGVVNPINALARMISALHDDAGRISVPGFYDDVLDLGEQEREAFAAAPFDEANYTKEIGTQATAGEPGYSLLERLWARPTLDVNGITGGFQGEGAKTVIASKASAKISCRLVANQDPQDIHDKLIAYLKKLAPTGVELSFNSFGKAKAALTPIESGAVQTAASALSKVYAKETVFSRTGGTIPVVSTFQELLGADVVLVGLGLESDKVHSPNEKFDLENYYKGIEVSANLLAAFAK